MLSSHVMHYRVIGVITVFSVMSLSLELTGMVNITSTHTASATIAANMAQRLQSKPIIVSECLQPPDQAKVS
jgi:hypothetical protein